MRLNKQERHSTKWRGFFLESLSYVRPRTLGDWWIFCRDLPGAWLRFHVCEPLLRRQRARRAQ